MWERDSTGDPFVCRQLCAFQRGSSRASFKLTIFKIIIEDNKLLEFAKHFTYSKCFDKFYLTWSSHLLLHNLVVVSSLISFVKDQSETREVWWFAQDHTVITVRTRMRILVLYQVILWSQVHLYSLKFRNPNRNNISYLSFPNSFSQNVTWPELLGNKTHFEMMWSSLLFSLGRISTYFTTEILMCSITARNWYICCMSHIFFMKPNKSSDFKSLSEQKIFG